MLVSLINIYSTIVVVTLNCLCSEASVLGYLNFIPFAFAKETSDAKSVGCGF